MMLQLAESPELTTPTPRGKRGPKTAEGKAVTRLNSVRHGVLCQSPVLPVVERDEDWDAYHGAMMATLLPDGHLETVLAEQVSQLGWRLRRVARYERETLATRIEGLQKTIEGVKDERGGDQSSRIGRAGEAKEQAAETLQVVEAMSQLPEEQPIGVGVIYGVLNDARANFGWDDIDDDLEDVTVGLPGLPEGTRIHEVAWTAGLLRRCLGSWAKEAGSTLETLLADLTRQYRTRLAQAERDLARLIVRAERAQRQCLLPADPVIARLCRYESHLERSLLRMLHELQRLQAARLDGRRPCPVAVDVTVTGGFLEQDAEENGSAVPTRHPK